MFQFLSLLAFKNFSSDELLKVELEVMYNSDLTVDAAEKDEADLDLSQGSKDDW